MCFKLLLHCVEQSSCEVKLLLVWYIDLLMKMCRSFGSGTLVSSDHLTLLASILVPSHLEPPDFEGQDVAIVLKCNPMKSGCIKHATSHVYFHCSRSGSYPTNTGILINFFFFLPRHTACAILVHRPGIEPMSPALEAQSLNHWTAREVPKAQCFLKKIVFTLFWLQIGSPLLHVGFLQLWWVVVALHCGAWVSHSGGFCCRGAQALGMRASAVVAHWLSCPTVCGIFLDQGLNPWPLHLADRFFFFF